MMLSLASLGFGRSVASPPSELTPLAIVHKIYTEYAWETLEEYPPDKAPLFVAPPAVLRQYFDSAFTQAILADRACAVRTQGECNLDFDPVWDSQDPSESTVRVVATRDPTVIEARIHHAFEDVTTVMTYHFRRTRAGWRIYDMRGNRLGSVLRRLQRPVP
jgi:hypothetical protein